MIIDPATPSAAQASGAKAQSSAMQIDSDYQSFLKLLTAQITNQNPLEPMDSTTFVSQLAQLSQVEQAVSMNANLERISGQLANAGMLGEMQLIGKTVTVPSESVTLENGEASLKYAVEAGAAKVQINILSEDGAHIRTLDGLSTYSGSLQNAYWDGRNSSGQPVSGGRFKVLVVATDTNGNAVNGATYDRTTVRGLSMTGGNVTLELSNGETASPSTLMAIE